MTQIFDSFIFLTTPSSIQYASKDSVCDHAETCKPQENKTVATSNGSSRARAARPLNSFTLDPTLNSAPRGSALTQARATSSRASRAFKALPLNSSVLGTTTPESSTQLPSPPRPKRRREHEEEATSKRQKQLQLEDTPIDPPLPLDSVSLDLAEEVRLEILNGMGSEKRTLSRRGSNADTTNDATSTSSQKTSFSLLDYRLVVLDRARIFVQHSDLPEHIQSLVDRIVQADLSDQKKRALDTVADKLCDGFLGILGGASREDDFVELIERALEAIDELVGRVFTRRRKAGPLVDPNDPQALSPKRQKAKAPYMSPENSHGDMPPPSPKPESVLVKTPRPDITSGYLDSVITAKLRNLGVDELNAEEMLKDLQFERVLLSSPMLPAHLARFPPLVVEGKGYGTGKSMYEAENQAAVSGSCMLIIQHQIAELTEQWSPGSHQRKEPLAFSICHEGPNITLWVHYYSWIGNVPSYNMHILAQCHATLRSTVETYLVALLGVMQWASSELLDDIAAQLFLLWQARQQ
ncbi:MAG: hypothetical protein Q9212_002563 [Teloschistes hypoglaucus]